MAQKLLHRAQIAAVLQQMSGEGMPQRMRRGAGRQAEPAAQILHQGFALRADSSLCRAARRRGARAPRIEGAGARILLHRLAHGREHGHGAFLAPLADDGERLAQGRIAAFETEGFGDAQARSVEQRQQRRIARRDPGLFLLPGFGDGADRVHLAQGPRQRARKFGAAHAAQRRAVGKVLAFEVAVERAQPGQRALHAAGPETFGAALGQKGADIGGTQGAQRGKRDRAAAVKDQEAKKAPHIVAIGAQRVAAHAPFMGKARQPGMGQFIHAASHRNP